MKAILALAILCLTLPACFAKDKEAEKLEGSLKNCNLGTAVSGESTTLEQLEGKVVMLEMWGTKCGPCLAAMPLLTSMDKQYSKKGFRLIGIECQDSSDQDILSVVKEKKIKFLITKGGSGPKNISGIPHSFLFNAKGELIFEGHPTDSALEKLIKRELKNVSATGLNAGDKSEEEKKIAGPLIPMRVWKNDKGDTIEASLLRVEGERVTFCRKNGVSFTSSLTKFCADDQALINEAAAKAKLELGTNADSSKETKSDGSKAD